MKLVDLTNEQRQAILSFARTKLGDENYGKPLAQVGEEELINYVLQSVEQPSAAHPSPSTSQEPTSCWTVLFFVIALVVGYIAALSWLREGKSAQWWHFFVAIPLGLFVFDLWFNGSGITSLLLSMLFTPLWNILKIIGLPVGMIALGVFLHIRGLGGWTLLQGVVYLFIAIFLRAQTENYSPWDSAQRKTFALLHLNASAGYLIGIGLLLSAIVSWIL